MIQLTPHEAHAVFSALIPSFRPNSRGHYSGRAFYRDGDNPIALSVDANNGRFFDHVTGKGGDVIAFVGLVNNCGFIAAVRFVSDIIGRPLLDERTPPRRRTGDARLRKAHLFAIGFAWFLDRYLTDLKQLWLLSESAVDSARIHTITRLLAAVKSWSAYDTAEFLRLWGNKRCNSALVATCIAEAQEAEEQICQAIAQLAQRRAA